MFCNQDCQMKIYFDVKHAFHYAYLKVIKCSSSDLVYCFCHSDETDRFRSNGSSYIAEIWGG